MYIVVSHTPLRFTLCSLGTSPEAHILSFHIHQKFHASLGKRKSFLEHFFFFQLFTFVLKVILWDLCWYSCHTECIKWKTDIKRTRLMYSKNKNNRSNMVPPSYTHFIWVVNIKMQKGFWQGALRSTVKRHLRLFQAERVFTSATVFFTFLVMGYLLLLPVNIDN